MNLLNVLKPKGKKSYYDNMKPIMYICFFIGLFISFPSVQSNFGFIKNSMLKDYDNVFYIIAFFCAAACLDFTKSLFFSKFVTLYYDSNKSNLDAVCLVGAIIFFSMSLFFSYNYLENKHQQEEVSRIEIELQDSTFSTSKIIVLDENSNRSERKKAEANVKTLKAAKPIIEDRKEKLKSLSKLKAALVSKDFYWLIMLDLILYFCIFAAGSIKAKETEETDLEDSDMIEINKELEAELITKLKARYRAAMSNGNSTLADKYKSQLLKMGAKVPKSQLKSKDDDNT